MGSIELPIRRYRGLFLGVKWPLHEAVYLSLSSTKCKECVELCTKPLFYALVVFLKTWA